MTMGMITQLRHNNLQVPVGSQVFWQACQKTRAHQLAKLGPTMVAKSSRSMRRVKRWEERVVARKLPYLVRHFEDGLNT